MSAAAYRPEVKAALLRYQRAEETAHVIYSRMAAREKDLMNKAILLRIAKEEKEHAAVWRGYTGVDAGPCRLRVFLYTILSYVMGYTFVVKWMEYNEYNDAHTYETLVAEVPDAKMLLEQEQAHERQLAEMLDEDRLQYVGAMVLGLNDALVELTGTLAGLTLALQHTRVVALAGIITGVSATLSMAASNYLAERAEGRPDALKSSFYTGAAYLATVVLLVLPYLLFPETMYLWALACMLATMVLVIFGFNYYISVAKSLPFTHRFLEMAGISLGVTVISFGIGLLAKHLLGVDI